MHDISAKEDETYKNATHVQFELGLDFKDLIRVYGGEETYQIPHDMFNYVPYRQSYWIGLEIHKEFNDSFEIKGGITHKCTHPVNCWNKMLSTSNEASTELYISIKGKLDVL